MIMIMGLLESFNKLIGYKSPYKAPTKSASTPVSTLIGKGAIDALAAVTPIRGIGSAAKISGTAPKIAGALGSAAKTALKSAATYTAEHPIKALKIGATGATLGIVGTAAIRSNPKIVTQGAPAVVDFLGDVGTTAGEISKSRSFSDVYGHLKTLAEDHPALTTAAGLAAAGAIGGTALNAYNQLKTRKAIEQLSDQGIPVNVETSAIPPVEVGAIPQYSNLLTETTSYDQVDDNTPTITPTRAVTVYKRKKSKSIKRPTINIRNYNILANKQGR